MGTTCLRCSTCSTTTSSVSYLRMKKIVIALFIVALTCVATAFGAELQNTGKDCWYKCNSKQGPCSWCGTAGMCCKKGINDKSNGCDGTFGGSTHHECVLKFVHTDRGVTCSDSGFVALSTAQECSGAVSYAKLFNSKARYQSEGSRSNDPKGCYIFDSGKMYFNKHPTGAKVFANRRTINICRKGGFFDGLFGSLGSLFGVSACDNDGDCGVGLYCRSGICVD